MQQQPGDTGFDADLYDRFAATVFTYLLNQVQNEQDAEDLLLEVFLAALGNEVLANLSPQEQLAWLRRVARNKVIDRYRHVALLNLLPIRYTFQLTTASSSAILINSNRPTVGLNLWRQA